MKKKYMLLLGLMAALIEYMHVSGSAEMRNKIIQHEDPNIEVNSLDQRPLHYTRTAAEVHDLVGRGADINHQDSNERTPLMHALQEGHEDVAHALLQHGADPTLKDIYGNTALHYAKSGEMVHTLVAKGVRVEDNKIGEGPLHTAENKKVVEALVAHGANVNARSSEGKTPLHNAVDKKVIRALVKHGADKNAKDNQGLTPLHRAILLSNRVASVDTIIALIKSGVKITADDIKFAETRRNPNKSTIEFLKEIFSEDLKKSGSDGDVSQNFASSNFKKVGSGRKDKDSAPESALYKGSQLMTDERSYSGKDGSQSFASSNLKKVGSGRKDKDSAPESSLYKGSQLMTDERSYSGKDGGQSFASSNLKKVGYGRKDKDSAPESSLYKGSQLMTDERSDSDEYGSQSFTSGEDFDDDGYVEHHRTDTSDVYDGAQPKSKQAFALPEDIRKSYNNYLSEHSFSHKTDASDSQEDDINDEHSEAERFE